MSISGKKLNGPINSMDSVATILMNETILVNNLLAFHFISIAFHIIRHQMLFCKLETSCCGFKFQSLYTRTTLLNIRRVTRKCIFSSYSNFLAENRSFVVSTAIAVLLFSNKAIIRSSSRFNCQRIAAMICMTDFTAKGIYFVIRCEAKFF